MAKGNSLSPSQATAWVSWLQVCLSSVAPAGGTVVPLRLQRTNPTPHALDPGPVLAKAHLGHAHPPRLRLPSLWPLQGVKPGLQDTGSHGGKKKKVYLIRL